MKIQPFFDKRTSTLTYVVHDEASKVGVVIDSVMDFDPKNGRTWYESCEAVAQYIDQQRLTIPYVLDTHAHALLAWHVERPGVKECSGEAQTRMFSRAAIRGKMRWVR